MFENLTEKLNQTFKRLRGHGKLSEGNIEEALKEVRITLLEADVNFKVVKEFVNSVKARAVGSGVLESLTPGQQVVKIVNEELTNLLGAGDRVFHLSGSPAVVVLYERPGGIAAVWAEENSRDALFTAMRRVRKPATSGNPR